jgi:Kef-type K+ transport system membrane component KefB
MLAEFTSSVAFQMSLLLAVALGGYLLAMRINQSAVIGVILVGIIFGPSVLNLIHYTEFVASVAELGAIFLLFVVGLEFKLEDITRPKYFVIALLGVIVPWLGGFLLAKAFGFAFPGAILIGTALTATSIAITANVLREMGKLKDEAAKAIIGAAVIDDILGLLVLSISFSAVAGEFSISSIVYLTLKAAAFLLIGIFVGYVLLSRAVIKLDQSKIAKKYPEFAFLFCLMIAFTYAMLAELVGLSAIVGAFIAGVSLEGIILRNSKSYHEGTEYLYIIFAGLFFVSLGVLVDFGAMTWFTLIFLIVLTIVAVLTKLIGCTLPARMQGYSWKDSLVIGFGMSPRGEVAMIVALLGLSKGLIGQDIYVSLLLMSLITTIITPLTLRNWLYKSERKERLDVEVRNNKVYIVKKEKI